MTLMDVSNGKEFNGDLDREKFYQKLFQQKGHETVSRYNLTNPHLFGVAAVFAGSPPNYNKTATADEALVSTIGNVPFIVACNSTIYDVIYRSVNQTITIETISPSILDVSQSINGPMMIAQQVVQPSLQMRFLYSMAAAYSEMETANTFGRWYSETSLAFSIAAFEEVPSLAERTGYYLFYK
ncbi:hypothetical protein EPUS_07903 [Endocarpon pusillum Z07020]|uniref:Uncharacterized protein n=1 Tax=Endocarpon pusillum (strain Z07020 / HMAS-L-300199) TaxID=1263415 RepID=U1GKN5_ENDPU|nr:uncharacterized protein EPUS_07903 [Endocarpon pusillum Z07020]ERF72446.1 hypothetical protein EPUS_07903 [Endocarpon pusillum Z07020]